MTDTEKKDWNLDTDVSEYFTFVLGGHAYKMRYPTASEVLAISKEPDQEKQSDMMYEFIVPETDGPYIKELLSQTPINKLLKFNEMVSKEFLGT
jgi:hypothetical protein